MRLDERSQAMRRLLDALPMGPAIEKLTAYAEEAARQDWLETLAAARRVYMPDEPMPSSTWRLSGPDADGNVWISFTWPEGSSDLNLGKLEEVREKLIEWMGETES